VTQHRYLPHTDEDVQRMLRVVGKPSVEALFSHIPERLRAKRPLEIEALDEGALLAHLGMIGAKSQPAIGAVSRDGAALSFLGAGLVPHTIPTAVDMLLQRSEWYTSYTPYQPEVSQGTLQAVFEFQTMVSEIFGLPVANASMYDGASATAEAVLMAQRVTDRRRVIFAGAVHPQYVETVRTYLSAETATPEQLADVEHHVGVGADGRVDVAALEKTMAAVDDVACVVVQTPSFYGVVEDVARIAKVAHERGALLVTATAEPVAFGVVAPPGACGADIAVGEGMGLAIPPTCGGPGVGLFAARADLVRQMPGRLVGETVDRDGRRGYVLTLATREQHIRREKATSNICTNQGLIALAFTIHMSLLGKRGFVEMARLCLAKTEYLKAKIAGLQGFSLPFSGPTFNEFAVRVRGGDATRVVEKLVGDGIFAGVPAAAPGLLSSEKDLLLIAVTERHSRADLDRLVARLDEVAR
jgi:glycine dehydrogenase subunit 1